jgi:hypothetical protein
MISASIEETSRLESHPEFTLFDEVKIKRFGLRKGWESFARMRYR